MTLFLIAFFVDLRKLYLEKFLLTTKMNNDAEEEAIASIF